MKVYEARIVEFSNVDKTDFGYSYEITHENYKKKDCIKYGSYMININTHEKYYILKRTENGTLDKQDVHDIFLGIEYVHSYQEKQNVKPLDFLKAIKTKISVIKSVQKTLKR